MRQIVANVEVIRANPRRCSREPAAVAGGRGFCHGQNRKSLSMPLRPFLPDADMERGRSLRTLATLQAWWPLPTDRISRDGRDHHASPLPRALDCRKDCRTCSPSNRDAMRAEGGLSPEVGAEIKENVFFEN
jgi:hypothetical protein